MDVANNKRLREETSHHEQTHKIQTVFAQHVSVLTDVFVNLKNGIYFSNTAINIWV